MFDWSLAQEAWSDEQKNVWADIEKMWRNFEITTWSVIQDSQEWNSFASDAIKEYFINDEEHPKIHIRAWRNICFLTMMYPELDVYYDQHCRNGTIKLGRKEIGIEESNPIAFFLILPALGGFEINPQIIGNQYLYDDPMIVLRKDTEDAIAKIADVLNQKNVDGKTFAECLNNYIQQNPLPNRQRYLPRDYNNQLHEPIDMSELTLNQLWDDFLDRWPIENLPHLTIEEYTDTNNQNTFCYWVERKTYDIGSIQGSTSFKFGIFKPMAFIEQPDQRGKRFQNGYSWYIKYGDNTTNAFNAIKQNIIAVANASKAGNLQAIEEIDLAAMFKWKIAFLYQNRDNPVITPIFAINILTFCSQRNASYQDIYPILHQLRLTRQQPIFQFATSLIAAYKNAQNKINESEKVSLNDTSNHVYPLNVIFYGPPGTGKTYTTTERAVRICDSSFDTSLLEKRKELNDLYQDFLDEGKIVFTTFHQSYSYEDFMEGIKATAENGQISYEPKDGVFKELCEKAKNAPNDNFVLIIDEINRGNISRIFGELITLIETSKRAGNSEELSVTLPYTKECFSVPQNVYIIGTMNTADRSLAGLDLALRRRFHFEEMMPNTEILNRLTVEGVDIKQLLTIINQRIEVLLDREHTIGHAYFMKLKEDGKATIATLSDIFLNQIIPLLQEYFFEDWEKINMVLGGNGFVTSKDFDENLFNNQNKPPQKKIWTINEEAFNKAENYKKIYTAN